MKKTNLILSLVGIALLSSCGSTPNSSDNSSDANVSNSVENSSSVSSNMDSNVVSSNSSSGTMTLPTNFTLDENMIKREDVVLYIGETYYLPATTNDNYKGAWLDYYIEDKSVANLDAEEIFHGLKEGTTKVRIVADEEYYDDITITVIGDDKMKTDFSTGAGNLYGKSFVVYGDSISDVNVTAYPNNRPAFWCEQLRDKYNMTMYNHAKSGYTAGYCKGLMKNGGQITLVGTSVVKQAQSLEDISKSDYAFIYFGNNDFTYGCTLGEIGEVNDGNYNAIESFRGSYSYIIDKIRSANPDIKIVCLSLSYSTWGLNPADTTVEYAKTRKDMCGIVKEIAEAKECKYIDIFDLWNETTFTTHCPDGIHPQTSGYELLVERILEN